ncbi:MAG: preprotein translocase subunit YajC [Planctomycetota bacterium]
MTSLLQRTFALAAEAGGAAGGAADGADPQSPLAGILSMAPIFLIIIAFFWFTSRSRKKREQKRSEMLDNLRPKEDVLTIGGLHGRIVRIQDDEVVLRIDPEKDIKITIAKSGISRRLGEEEPE